MEMFVAAAPVDAVMKTASALGSRPIDARLLFS
jgi:hypothetical protein